MPIFFSFIFYFYKIGIRLAAGHRNEDEIRMIDIVRIMERSADEAVRFLDLGPGP